MLDDKIIPFGKYKGQPIEVLQNDPSYADWLQGQSWVKDRYASLYAIIINNFSETQDTPEHNAMQALFLDDSFCQKTMHAWFDNRRRRGDIKKSESYPGYVDYKQFEKDGIDVTLHATIWFLQRELKYGTWSHHEWDCCPYVLNIELKPSIGDDYPGIIRSVRQFKEEKIVIYEKFNGIGVTENQMKEMFSYSGIFITTTDEINLYPDVTYTSKAELMQKRLGNSGEPLC
jgi:hypothetical protein